MVDASMDLLNQILRQPVDPDYAVTAAGPAAAAVALVVRAGDVTIGALLAIAALQTNRPPRRCRTSGPS